MLTLLNRALCSAFFACLLLTDQAPAQAQWQPTFTGLPGADGEVFASAVYDDGSGPALYIAGDFESASGLQASNIARWNGATWEPVAGGIYSVSSPAVRTLRVFDAQDGRGPGLYAGGFFTQADSSSAQNIARYDGGGWSSGGSGLNGVVDDLEVFDDGSGPALYACGSFFVGGFENRGIARLVGDEWHPLPIPFSGNVHDIQAFQSEQGPRLILTGLFLTAAGLTQDLLAQWDGAAWSDVGSGVDLSLSNRLASFDDGGGERLFLTGIEVPLQSWDGSTWTTESSASEGFARELAVHSHSGNEALFGLLVEPLESAPKAALWTGSAWQAFDGMPLGYANGLGSLGDLGEDSLVAFGQFPSIQLGQDALPANSVARWSQPEGWSAFGPAHLGVSVDAQALFDDGSGHGLELYVAGGAGGISSVASSLLRWRAGEWEPIVVESGGLIEDLMVFDWDGDGVDELIAGGSFTDFDLQSLAHLASYDGIGWEELAGGTDQPVRCLHLFEDGKEFPEPTLFIGGDFDKAGNELHVRVAYWSGSAWGHLGGNNNWTGSVFDLATYDRGDGPELYATGSFGTADGALVRSFARWSGEAWRAVGGTENFGLHFGWGRTLEVYDDGLGESLYVGGDFTAAGASTNGTRRIARTNGFNWFKVGEGFNNTVQDLVVHDGGPDGARLVAGGGFIAIGQGSGATPASGLAQWDGSAWTPLSGSELEPSVRTLQSVAPGLLPIEGLLVGGSFSYSPAGDAQLARWGSAQAELAGVPGCSASGPLLQAGVGALAPGGGFDVFVTSVASPLASLQLYVGAGLAGQCGLELPGLGELLIELAPFPTLLAGATATGGHAALTVSIPSEPALVGQTATLQALAVDLSGAGPALELSQGLVGTL